MTTFLVFVAILAAGAVGLAAVGLPRPRKTGPAGPAPAAGVSAVVGPAGLAEPDPRLPPVLLPEQVQPGDIGKLKFSVALRGYRMDQVDAVLARLESALADRDAALAAARRPPDNPGTLPGRPGTP